MKHIKELDETNFFKIVEKSKGNKFIYFYKNGCEPCELLYPQIVDLLNENFENIGFYKIDIVKNNIVAEKLKIRFVPAVAIIKDSCIVYDQTGSLISIPKLRGEIYKLNNK